MKITICRSFVKWMAAFLSCFTMVFSPVAMGEEATSVNKDNLRRLVENLGVDRKITVGEFWENSKEIYSGENFKTIEKYAERNRNLLMPIVEIDDARGTDGILVPVARITYEDKTYNVQFFGGEKNFAKVNGHTFSRSDFFNFDTFQQRIEAGDERIRLSAVKRHEKRNKKKGSTSLDEMEKDLRKFDGFPRFTPQLWSSMSLEERVKYIVSMRTLWNDAVMVRTVFTDKEESGKEENKETSSIENFLKVILGKNANAVERPTGPCVVAGYVGTYGWVTNDAGPNRWGCSVANAISAHTSSIVQDANTECASRGPNLVACNPIVYGYPTQNCVNKNSPLFQFATTFTPGNRGGTTPGGLTCDERARLSTSEGVVPFVPEDSTSTPMNLRQRIESIEKEQRGSNGVYTLTRNFLDSVTRKKQGGKSLEDYLSGPYDPNKDDFLSGIQEAFEVEIGKAVEICVANSRNNVDKNQVAACQQLHRRWLFVDREIAKYRQRGCLDGSKYVGSYDGNELSSSNETKMRLNSRRITVGQKVCECREDRKTVAIGERCGGGGLDGGISPWWLLAGALGIGAILCFGTKVLKSIPFCKQDKKKPPVCPAGQTGTPPNCTTPGCPADSNGTPPNACVCTAPKTGTPGACACPACPGGVTPNPISCVCAPPECPAPNQNKVYPGCVTCKDAGVACPQTPYAQVRDPSTCLCVNASENPNPKPKPKPVCTTPPCSVGAKVDTSNYKTTILDVIQKKDVKAGK